MTGPELTVTIRADAANGRLMQYLDRFARAAPQRFAELCRAKDMQFGIRVARQAGPCQKRPGRQCGQRQKDGNRQQPITTGVAHRIPIIDGQF